ncbi:MAG: recombination regulator RecX [Pseudomonadota bacterium]|nr:recombination regulator RecX [Pseudomonadota bacterium]
MKAAGPDTPAQLKARALRHLARREHSRAELARKLAPHAESAEALDGLILELQQKKQLSDARYAEARAHQLARKYGPARILQDLQSKGIAAEIAESVPVDNEMERARAIIARKYRTSATTREERAKRARFLQGRGFSGDVIRRLVLRGEND